MRKCYLLLLYFALIQCVSSPRESSDDKDIEHVQEVVVEPATIVFDETEGEAATTRNFYFLFDVSGSMNHECAGQRKIDGAKQAIFEFLKNVPDNVNMGLLFFGVDSESGIREMVPLGPNKLGDFEQNIRNATPIGNTPLDIALHHGSQELISQYKKQLGYGEYRLILITDGLASNPVNFTNMLYELKRYPFIALYSIGLCIDANHELKLQSLKYSDADDYEEFEEALKETIAEAENFDPEEFDPEELQELIESD